MRQTILCSKTFSCAFAGLSLLVLLGGDTLRVDAAVIYANASQTNNVPDGTSWPTAYKTVQEAITAASYGDSVWVAAGTYFENITLSNGVALYGGFNSTETDVSQRNWATNWTILDGRRSNSVIAVVAGATNTTRIDGCVVSNGLASAGGGIYASNASPTIANNTILQNQASQGGGIFAMNGSSTVVSNIIFRNQALYGGGIYCDNSNNSNAMPVIRFNLIQENVIARISDNNGSGGGICLITSSAKIQFNRILGNAITQLGSSGIGSHLGGGGISCIGIGSPEISGNLIAGNVATVFKSLGGGICVGRYSSPSIFNNTIVWNESGYGGGIYCDSMTLPGNPSIRNNIVAFNATGITNGRQPFQPPVFLANNCVFGNGSRNYVGPDPTGTNGNISVDPQLAPNSLYPDAHLQPTSPCRDAGDNTVVQPEWLDVYGGPRVVDGTVDIGAAEYNGPTAPIIPTILRVSSMGNDANDGSSWAGAKRTLQAAIDLLTTGATEVWVQAGMYNENLTLRPFRYLYGGFSGDETNRAQRDWLANLTVVDGGQTGSVVKAANLAQMAIIDGFVIQNGRASNGAGILCIASAPVIANNTITANVATKYGGGIACSEMPGTTWAVMVTNNVISFNNAESGGGIHTEVSNAVIAFNHIEGNVAADTPTTQGGGGGGGVQVVAATILNNFFLNNIATNGFTCTASTNGTSNAWAGGGVLSYASSAPVRIRGNTFLGNLAYSSCSGFLCEGGGAINVNFNGAEIANNLIAFGSSGVFALFEQNIWNNCVFGNERNYSVKDLTGLRGNISVDPLLLAPNDYHFASNSPCINAGNNAYVSTTTDFDGNPRIAGGTVDIGAYEFQNPSSVISYAWLQQYGLSIDGSADYADTDNDLLNNWQEWRAGTEPTNALSLLKMLTLSNDVSGTTVSWQSTKGVSYSVQRSDLTEGRGFSTIQSNVLGQAGTNFFTDTNAIGAPQLFYRVGVQ